LLENVLESSKNKTQGYVVRTHFAYCLLQTFT